MLECLRGEKPVFFFKSWRLSYLFLSVLVGKLLCNKDVC